MRDYAKEFDRRVDFIRQTFHNTGATGVVFGNSGGKDCALVGILCKAACADTVGVMMPCDCARNYEQDTADAKTLAKQFGIETRTVDLTPAKAAIVRQTVSTHAASAGIAPRLRMTVLYAIAASENRLVAGTGNRSEIYMGYFTKWGDGGYDFNPIADLTTTEVYEFLRFLNAPACVIEKPPSAALFDGQTDEADMGITYAKIDAYLLHGHASQEDAALIERFHQRSGHKYQPPIQYKE